MEAIVERCCGLDVHQRSVVAGLMIGAVGSRPVTEVRRYGTTTRQLVALLRRSGASEVHVRITCPPMRHPCFLGVDTATYEQLIAANQSVPEIRATINADSLGYLSEEGLVASTGRPRSDFCMGCFTGTYPAGIHEELTGKVREPAGVGS